MKQIKQAIIRLIVSIIDRIAKRIEDSNDSKFDEFAIDIDGWDFIKEAQKDGLDTQYSDEVYIILYGEILPDFRFLSDEIEEGYTFEKMKGFIDEGKTN